MKKIIVLLMFVFFANAEAQNFKPILKIPDSTRYYGMCALQLYPFEDYLFVATYDAIYSIDKNHNIKHYDYWNSIIKKKNKFEREKINTSYWEDVHCISQFGNNYYANSSGGIFIFKPLADSIDWICDNKPDFHHHQCNLPVYFNKCNMHLGYVVDDEGKYIYQCDVKTLRKIRADSLITIDSVIKEYCWHSTAAYPPTSWEQARVYYSHIDMMLDDAGIIWLPQRYAHHCENGQSDYNKILTFDTKKTFDTNAFATYNFKNILHEKGENVESAELINAHIFNQNHIKVFLLKVEYPDTNSKKTLIICKHPDGTFDTTIIYENKFIKTSLLKHENHQWNILYPDGLTPSYTSYLYKWSDTEIAFKIEKNGNHNFLGIYNLLTHKVDTFYCPYSLYATVEWNGKRYFETHTALYVYEPDTSDNSISEPAIIKNYSLFPNPASDDCTLSMDLTEAGSINISLSDMLGRDIMQIYDGYADAGAFSKAFNTKHLASGMYFLNVRSGGESRTKGIAIY